MVESEIKPDVADAADEVDEVQAVSESIHDELQEEN